MKRKKRFPTFGQVLTIFLLFILFTMAFSLVLSMIPEKHKALGILIVYVFPMILTIGATWRIYDRAGKINYKPEHLSLLPLIVIGAFAFLIVGEMTVFLLPKPTGALKEMFEQLTKTMKILSENKIIGFTIVAIAAPILEEILFRGIILRALLKKFNPWKAIILSAVAFGFFHMNPWQFLYAGVVGIYLGYIYWKTKNLFYPILVHFILNSTAFISGISQDVDKGLTESLTDKDKIQFSILFIISIIVIYFLYKYFEKYFSKIPKTFVLATGNVHKIDEIKNILSNKINIVGKNKIGHIKDLIETGNTLKDNALQKLRQISIPYDTDVIADDTGLEVEALNGAPGVYSARYAGEDVTYEDNVKKLLEELKGIENRKARFRTIIAISDGNKEKIFEGIVNGIITEEPRGTQGFGYDSVFIPEGYNKTFAEMTSKEKNLISHRAKALEQLKDYFNN